MSGMEKARQQNRRLSLAPEANLYGSNGDPSQDGTVRDTGISKLLRYASLSNAGYEPDGSKKTNQDAYISTAECGNANTSFFAVFDGHGACGHLVSAYVRKELPKLLDDKMLKGCATDGGAAQCEAVKKMLTKGFETVNATLHADKGIDSSLSGTTAVAGLVFGPPGQRQIITANAGDSRAVLAYEEGGVMKVTDLSDDQKPDREDERKRVQSFGGRVEPLIDEVGEPIGPARVWLPNMMLPGLAMSRSIGDDIAATVGVHATPEVSVVPLTDKHKFMIVASDGVWEFLTSEDAVGIVVNCNGNAEKAAAELCARSYREWRAEEEVVDDITAVVVYFT